MRLSTLCFGIAVLLAPAAVAQEVTAERDGDEVTITRPDGTVEREDGERPLSRRHFELRRENGPRAFAFLVPPGAPPFRAEDFDVDSLLGHAFRFRLGPDRFDGDSFVPWPGFGSRGVDPATRHEIAEGDRQSRQLARQLRRAEGRERDRLLQELRATLEHTFDRKQQARRERAIALREEAERLRDDRAALEEELREREARATRSSSVASKSCSARPTS